MKVAYLFVGSPGAVNLKLSTEILPSLEEHRAGVEIVGMVFLDDNAYTLQCGDPLGQRLLQIAAQQHFPIVVCATCAQERRLGRVPGEGHGCSGALAAGVQLSTAPDPYTLLEGVRPDRVITV